jgi:hypothetical protein
MADVAGSTLEAIARYAPDIDVPPPAVLDQARRNLELQVAMLREFGAIPAAELGRLAGSRARRPGTTVDNWRRAHRVVALRWHDETLVPGFLLLADGRPDPVARPALTALAAQRFSDWQAALWWAVPAPALDGRRPVDLLLAVRGAPAEEVQRAADALAAAARRPRDWF